jgi:hypothetical protein
MFFSSYLIRQLIVWLELTRVQRRPRAEIGPVNLPNIICNYLIYKGVNWAEYSACPGLST